MDFAYGGAGGDSISVDDDDPTGERAADHEAGFAMILGFLAVEGPGHIALMVLGQGDGSGRDQWNALVGRPEQQVELQPGLHQCAGIAGAQGCHRDAVAEQAGVEEVGADTAGFKAWEFAEAQCLAREREFRGIGVGNRARHRPCR